MRSGNFAFFIGFSAMFLPQVGVEMLVVWQSLQTTSKRKQILDLRLHHTTTFKQLNQRFKKPP